MIGFFDSGLGGLQTLKYFKNKYPDFDYLFLADTLHAPYGTRSPEQIQKHTFHGLHRLFDQGCKIVIVACNTAAAYSIRSRQAQYPHLKALSVTVPAVEKMIRGGYVHMGILGTQATVLSGVYQDLFQKFGGKSDVKLSLVMAQELVSRIESGEKNKDRILDLIQSHLDQFPPHLDALILGCTHFPIWMPYFRQLFGGEIIDPALEATNQFSPYLSRHPEIADQISRSGKVRIAVTSASRAFLHKAQKILPEIEKVELVKVGREKKPKEK